MLKNWDINTYKPREFSDTIYHHCCFLLFYIDPFIAWLLFGLFVSITTTMLFPIVLILSIFTNFIHCQFQPLSEPFILAAYDPDYSPYDDNKIMNQNIQRFGYNKTKVILSKHINTTNIYLEGRILDNSSYQIDATLIGMFIRVDKFTHRLKLCPNGKTSRYFSIEKDMLFYKNDTIWSVCYDEFEDVSYIYHGSIDDNKKYCCPDNGKEIILRTLGKYDASGALPDYTKHPHKKNSNVLG